jgi:hypothetical protein
MYEWLVRNQNATAEIIAHREGSSHRNVTMTISLTFLSPALVKAALDGGLPRWIGVTRLCDMLAEWSQRRSRIFLERLPGIKMVAK